MAGKIALEQSWRIRVLLSRGAKVWCGWLPVASALAVSPVGVPLAIWPSTAQRVEIELTATEPALRRKAAQQLAVLPRSVARRLAMQAIRDPDPQVRRTVAQLAVSLNMPELGETVIPWLVDTDRSVRLAAAELLAQVPTLSAVAALARTLGDTEPTVRSAAAKALGAHRQAEAVLPLLGRLDDPVPEVRKEVVQALGRLRDRRAVLPLMTHASDSRALVRKAILRALSELMDERAVNTFTLALRDEDESVRVAALGGLAKMRNSSAEASILQLLEVETQAPVRAAAFRALALTGASGALKHLVSLLGAPHTDQQVVLDALVRAGSVAQGAMFEGLREARNLRQAAGCALGLVRLRHPQAVDAIRSALHQGIISSQSGLQALAELHTSSGLEIALEYINDLDPAVRQSARKAAFASLNPNQPDGRAVEPIEQALLKATSGIEQAELVELLGRTRSVRAFPLLSRIITGTQEPELQRVGLLALGRVGENGCTPLLLQGLMSEWGSVRLAAAAAIRQSEHPACAVPLLKRWGEGEARALITLALPGPMARTAENAPIELALRLVQGATSSERDGLFEALGSSGLPAATAGLIALARQVLDPKDRAKLAEILSGRVEALGILRNWAHDPEVAVRANAIWSIGSVGNASEIPLLVASTGDLSTSVAANAIASLSRLAIRLSFNVKPHLCAELAADRAELRSNALRALRLTKLRCSEAMEHQLLLRDPDEGVRTAAAWLIGADPTPSDLAVLEYCSANDPNSSVAALCTIPGLPDAGLPEPTTVFVVPLGNTEPQPSAPFALVRGDGLIRYGVSDRRGAVFERDAPRGSLRLAVPAGANSR